MEPAWGAGLFGSVSSRPRHSWSPDTPLLSVLRLRVSVLASGHLLSVSLEFSLPKTFLELALTIEASARCLPQEGLRDGPAACVVSLWVSSFFLSSHCLRHQLRRVVFRSPLSPASQKLGHSLSHLPFHPQGLKNRRRLININQ